MDTGLISTRYASSLLDYAIASGDEKEVYMRMKLLSEMFPAFSRLRSSIANPGLTADNKKELIVTACGGTVPPSLNRMIDLILKNERETQLQYIALRFVELYREKFNIQYGKLTTAISIDETRERQLIARIQKITGSELEIESIVEPGIIGGFVLNLGDYRWDASVLGELNRIRNRFKSLQEK
ncbi:MAG: F0F1 ATP synthase subunit delta [Porphyromonadaceae bacterium]|nr:F0F1 ATP synthase subunit delta [Porphyromonadaceae bacterium]